MNPVKPGYKTTEGIASLLALIFSALVAVKWVPINVSTTVQADAVKAIPLITGLYSIARGITKAVHSGMASTPTSADTGTPATEPVEADSHPGL